ncbi:hypothetical protein [Meridianimarinicoccus aquatilis]|uniref:Uncharacterized protein n=1 Tax=Meridianimarinicoccus aquatilis TaxID=2552766 RepID=A0A4V3BB59_9RHOB|nr:hypothetical protein [Fluviibacterium aquatile]TDL85859.1 hypothetical protein E2L05_14425 [Fluviibacterium aquatile]
MATLEAPCAPYTLADITLGPLKVSEETDPSGTLSLTLPVNSGINTLSVEIEGQTLQAALPSSPSSTTDPTAVIWPDGERWGKPGAALAESGPDVMAYPLGFPSGSALIDLLSGPSVAYIEAIESTQTCGKVLRASIIQGGSVRPLQVSMPPCGTALGQTLRIPLGN